VTTGSFERQFETPRPAEECWAVLTDVDRLAGWVGIVGQVITRTPLVAYGASLEDRMGPFRLRADLDIRVTEREVPAHIRFRASGQDRQVGSRLTVDAGMHLVPNAGRTIVRFDGTYSVEGRVATLGGPMIRHKADAILDQFLSRAEEELR
jgi:carbon monoxide dehydrogenase subunit G